jgi:hypothetical protein
MNIEVEIYMSNIIKFFNENPNDLYNLVPKSMKLQFFDKIKEFAIKNADKGEDPSLTRQQLIDVCVEINGKSTSNTPKIPNVIVKTNYGEFSLN